MGAWQFRELEKGSAFQNINFRGPRVLDIACICWISDICYSSLRACFDSRTASNFRHPVVDSRIPLFSQRTGILIEGRVEPRGWSPQIQAPRARRPPSLILLLLLSSRRRLAPLLLSIQHMLMIAPLRSSNLSRRKMLTTQSIGLPGSVGPSSRRIASCNSLSL